MCPWGDGEVVEECSVTAVHPPMQEPAGLICMPPSGSLAFFGINSINHNICIYSNYTFLQLYGHEYE